MRVWAWRAPNYGHVREFERTNCFSLQLGASKCERLFPRILAELSIASDAAIELNHHHHHRRRRRRRFIVLNGKQNLTARERVQRA